MAKDITLLVLLVFSVASCSEDELEEIKPVAIGHSKSEILIFGKKGSRVAPHRATTTPVPGNSKDV